MTLSFTVHHVPSSHIYGTFTTFKIQGNTTYGFLPSLHTHEHEVIGK